MGASTDSSRCSVVTKLLNQQQVGVIGIMLGLLSKNRCIVLHIFTCFRNPSTEVFRISDNVNLTLRFQQDLTLYTALIEQSSDKTYRKLETMF